MSTALERPAFPDVAPESEWQGASPGRLTRLRRTFLRPVIVVPLVLAIAAGVWFETRSTSTSTAAPVTQTVAVTSGTMRQSVSAAGTLEPADSQSLSFSTSGQVTAVNVKAGQQVTKGAVLATLDSAALQSQVSQAQSTVDAAAARLSSDQSSTASAAQLTSDQASLNAAQAQLASAQTSLAGATLTSPIDGTVAVVNLTVGQQLSGTGASGTSISGTGTGSGRSSASSGSTSSGGSSSAAGGSNSGSNSNASSGSSSSTAQIQVISTGSYVVNLNVDDTQIARLATGQQATITPSSSPTGTGAGRRFGGAGGQGATAQGGTGGQGGFGGQSSNAQAAAGALGQTAATTATGTVTSVGAIASSSSGVASFPVVVTVTGTPSGFFAGSTVQVAITYNELPNVLEVPTLAITRTNGQDFVTVSQNGKHSQRAVTTGLVSGGQTQITGGLTRGELVVVTIPTAPTNGTTSNNTTAGNRGGGFGGPGGLGGGGGGAGGFVRNGD